jgi:hypothetical protein
MHSECKVKSFDIEAIGTDDCPIILASCFSLITHDACRIELGVKVDAVWFWYDLDVCLYEQRKTTNNLGQSRLCS